MLRRQASNKLMAMFVLAFLCLNVGGAFCLTYCTQIAMAASPAVSDDSQLSEHCRKAKKEAEERDKNATRIDSDSASCCMLPVSMFAAPVEKQTRTELVIESAELINVEHFTFDAPSISPSHVAITSVYRPPPLDRRVERITRSVFII